MSRSPMRWNAYHSSPPVLDLMIIDDFDFIRPRIGPDKTNAILFIDPNAILPLALSYKSF